MKALILGLLLIPNILSAQIEVLKQPKNNKSCFPIASNKSLAGIYFETTDFEVVKKAAKLFAADVERVTGKMPQMVSSESGIKGNMIIIGTVGKNRLIDELIQAKKLNVDSIRDQWERFVIKTIENPFPGVKQALLVAGSDRRGTAYGVFTISKAIGVSPWYWWADVPVQKSTSLYLKEVNYVSTSPSVKYRGIFINDEDWGMNQWAKKTFDPDFKNIGPKTYEKVFELMLRLRMNYIWPAMHPCTTEFGSVPENATLADQYGIVAGSSHCEPMLCNNVHWNQKVRGPWNYSLNRDTIHAYWEENVKARNSEEAVWTLGIRGIHDQGMQKPPVEIPDRIKLVNQVFKDQRDLIDSYVSKQWGPIAQCFVPYKEVLPLYDAGLEVPEDVTLVWVDDNFGYMRRLSSLNERKRPGGAGIYWHLSYYGWPHSYTWINTTAPALMWEELNKSWENDTRTLWVVNVGDLKPMEIGIDYFADLAWNLGAMGPNSQPVFLHSFAAEHFGDKLAQQISGLLGEFYRLGTIHKPELMNRAWALGLPAENAAQLNSDYTNLLKKEEAIASKIPVAYRDAYFELVGFPARVLGASGLIFMSDRKIQLGRDSIALTKEITRLRGFLEKQVAQYNNETAGGKWKYMMPGLETAKNLTQWNSQVRWPWGEKINNQVSTSENAAKEVRQWRDAATANHQTTSGVAKWVTVPGLGSSGRALALLPTSPEFSWKVDDNSAPTLEFEFTPKSNQGDVLINFMPTFRISPGMQLRVVVGVDNQQPVEVEVPGSNGKEDENGPNRRNGIQNNFVQAKVSLTGLSAGKHILKIRAVDPGVVIDKVSLPLN